MMLHSPVDAVITWVDGTDPAHKRKLAHYLATIGISRPEAAAPTRFNQCGEIDFCVMSILQFAPWIRTIYIVTDAQTPPIMQKLRGTPYEDRVKLVDHRDIFIGFEEHLPTFNSLTIETLFWRIKGIANQFIYLNDDYFFIRPVSYEDFFYQNKLVLRGSWKVFSVRKWRNLFKKVSRYLLKTAGTSVFPPVFQAIQESSAKLVGFNTHYFSLPHAPFALKKEIFADFFLKHPEYLSENVKHILRHPTQFFSVSLAYHVEISNKNVVFDKTLKAVMVNGASHSFAKICKRLKCADKKKNVAFVCMQSLDAAPLSTQEFMFNWLKKRISV